MAAAAPSVANSNATIVNSGIGAGGVRIAAGYGAGAWNHFVGNADGFTLGVDGDQTTFDIEASLPQPASKTDCKGGGWTSLARADGSTFRNQGNCVQYVNTGK